MTKPIEGDDKEVFLTTLERAVHRVENDKRKLAPQLTGKRCLAYTAMTDEDARDYDRVKTAIFQGYDINDEIYRQ